MCEVLLNSKKKCLIIFESFCDCKTDGLIKRNGVSVFQLFALVCFSSVSVNFNAAPSCGILGDFLAHSRTSQGDFGSLSCRLVCRLLFIVKPMMLKNKTVKTIRQPVFDAPKKPFPARAGFLLDCLLGFVFCYLLYKICKGGLFLFFLRRSHSH